MKKSINRREFLKLSSLTLGALALRPLSGATGTERGKAIGMVRVAHPEVEVFTEPAYNSPVAALRKRDQLLYVYEKLVSPDGPAFNPRWYRVEGGFMHTAYLQPVKSTLNPTVNSIPESGQLFEVTVPLTQSMRYSKYYGWEPLYRLYYQSNHWVTGVDSGPNGQPWYQITDDLLKINYHVPAKHMRLIPAEELTPLSVHVPPEEKRIEVSKKRQSLRAYEGDKLVLYTNISTGIPNLPTTNGVPTDTPIGKFNVQLKMPVRHMGDGAMTSDIFAYELPGVPWVTFFAEHGVAFHGTYWHDNYGNEMSHGCVNMRPEEAKWLFRWVTPVSEPGDWERKGRGTRVQVSL
ncbi:MAG: L,D-transpeptidase [Anaerolineae bacterium]|nr:L,D-transpeptidase [Anaerolineae bacterium]